MKKVIIGSDHAGYEIKERIKKALKSDFDFVDVGTESAESVDYPVYAARVAKQVAVTPGAQGVLVCGSAVGMSIAANKVHGIRCALAYSKRIAVTARQHNDANVVAVPGREDAMDDPVEIVRTFLTTDFSNEDRHARRVQQLMELEKN